MTLSTCLGSNVDTKIQVFQDSVEGSCVAGNDDDLSCNICGAQDPCHI